MKKIPSAENEIATSTPVAKFPLQMDSAKLDFGGKSKLRKEKVVMRDTKTGVVYGSRVIYQKTTETTSLLSELLLLSERSDPSAEPLPEVVIGEIRSNIRKGAKDVEQKWSNALEIVNKAYDVAVVGRPTPIDKAQWKQYEELLQFAVQQLAATRGGKGEWRMSQTALREQQAVVNEARIFVTIPGMTEMELDVKNIDDAVTQVTNISKRHGIIVKVGTKDDKSAILKAFKGDEELEQITIRNVS